MPAGKHKKKGFILRMDDDIRNKLDAYVQDKGTTRTEAINNVLEKFLDNAVPKQQEA